jgi:hypothetical protein
MIDGELVGTHKAILATLAAGLALLFPTAIQAQALNACDLTADGVVDLRDVQLATNMAQTVVPCTANVAGAGVCNIVVVDRVTHAALSGACLTGVPHTVALNWTASTSSNVIGYNVYRGTVSGGPYTKLTSAPVSSTNYTDVTAQGGQTYYYVATAVDNSSNESAYSSPAVPAVVPTP